MHSSFIITIIIIFIATISITCATVITDLTPTNFNSVLNNNENVLVEFYSPQCGHCIEFEPEYNKLATLISQSTRRNDIVIARVDVSPLTGFPSLAEYYHVKGFPTLYLFQREMKNPKLFHRRNTILDVLDFLHEELDQ
jgi:thioredoxin-like negative regulator of GroEL